MPSANHPGTNIILLLLTTEACIVSASLGDRLDETQQCVQRCTIENCALQPNLKKFYAKQPLPEKLLFWSCEDECRYKCMWKTVDLFLHQGQSVPQFYGKWPFVRFWGMQEPASMIFSVLNGVAHGIGLGLYLAKVPKSSPLFYPSVIFGGLAVNAWFWSSVFHARDLPFTEKMDYFCATAVVLYSIYYCIHRMSLGLTQPDPGRGRSIRIIASLLIICFFIYHITYLSFRRFDYGYNMFVNVVAGLSNGFVWILYHFMTRAAFNHQWRATYAVIYTVFLLSFELLDFVPIMWVLDGHALWHLGTVFFPVLWYPFMIIESRIVEDTRFKIA